MKESTIETHLTRLVKAKGGLTFKFISTVAGVPDRIVIHKGKVYLVEVKQQAGELSEIQFWQHAEIAKRGAEVHVIWSWEAAEQFVDDLP